VESGILRAGIRHEWKLRIVYRDEQGRESRRTVWPVAMAFFERVRVLVAWCELRAAFRHFRTDRIVGAALTRDHFPSPRRLLLREWRKLERIDTPEF
jgi:predicted DNA-binding transcriptional regulator YafY